MSDAEYRVNDLERTVEELRFQVRWLKTQKETLEHQLERCREDGDNARIEATRWKMLYEHAWQRGNQWQKVAEALYCDFHDGGCPASEHNRKMQTEEEWPIGYSIDCDCGYDLYHKALNNE